MADKIKLALAVLLVIAGVAGFYYLGDKALILRIGSVLGGLVAAVLAAWTTGPGRQFHVYAQEAVAETRKVVWPSRKETVQTTGIVFLFVVVMAIFLWAVDSMLLWAVQMLMGRADG